MNGYMKSELFRLKKKKLNYLIATVLTIAIVALAIVLEYFAKTEPDFPYGNTLFYYSTVFSMSNLVLLIVCFLAVYLLGKDRLIIPVSIALGVERRTIYINKFIVSFLHFLIVILILGVATYLSGQFILTEKSEAVTTDFLISSFNLLPILISAFVLCYVATLIFDNEIVGSVIVFVFYKGLALLLFGITSVNENVASIANYIPASAINEILQDFMNGTVRFQIIGWIINVILVVLILIVGLKVVEKKDYV